VEMILCKKAARKYNRLSIQETIILQGQLLVNLTCVSVCLWTRKNTVTT